MSAPAPTPAEKPAGFRIPGLDGLRALAVFTVFLGHADLPFVLGAGTGVTVFFFFLSGYLITTLLRRERSQNGRVSIRDFYLRRVLRIPPMYIVGSEAMS